MFLTRKRAFARAGLLGNPSDGYHGKTISISVRNYWAEVVLYEWDAVEIVLADDDRAKFDSVSELARDVRLHGYYGGIRLIRRPSSGSWNTARRDGWRFTTGSSRCATKRRFRARSASPDRAPSSSPRCAA